MILRPANAGSSGSSGGAGGSTGGALNEWLVDRGFKALEVNDPLSAMAALCLIERGQAARSAWGLPRVDPLAMVVLEPARWPDLEFLLNAVQRFVPDAGIWRVQADELVAVRQARIDPAVVAPRAHAPLAPPVPALASVPSLALARESSPPELEPLSTESADDDLIDEAGAMVQTLRIALPAAAPSRRAARPTSPEPAAPPLASTSAMPPTIATEPEPADDADAADGLHEDTEPVRITSDELAMLLDEHFDSAETDSP